jgi:hypothetical protein
MHLQRWDVIDGSVPSRQSGIGSACRAAAARAANLLRGGGGKLPHLPPQPQCRLEPLRKALQITQIVRMQQTPKNT